MEPASDIADDLARRDFTINAMAIPLAGEPRLIDPYGGREDLAAGLLRVLHQRSFVDDPTRALRAARYAARFDFALEPETADLLREADLSTVSDDRRGRSCCGWPPSRARCAGFELLGEWGLVEPRPGGVELAARVVELLAAPPWSEVAPAHRALLAAALGPAGGGELELAAARSARPSEAVELARRAQACRARARPRPGAEWLDRYLAEWSGVGLEIDGGDLIAAGIPEGPALGRGLARGAAPQA